MTGNEFVRMLRKSGKKVSIKHAGNDSHIWMDVDGVRVLAPSLAKETNMWQRLLKRIDGHHDSFTIRHGINIGGTNVIG